MKFIHKFISPIYFWLFIIGTVLLGGCNHNFDNMLNTAGYEDSTGVIVKTPKVLILIVDGARGLEVRNAEAPNINSLLKNSIYSWNSLSDTLSDDATSWADLMTGVHKEKHGVLGESFSGNNLNEFPVFFKRIKEVNPSARLVSFSESSLFEAKLTVGADVAENFSSDGRVAKAIEDELKDDSSTVIVGQFGDIQKAGEQFGFSNDAPQYKSAILQFDTYLGGILNSLRRRPDYYKENWMVIVTSSHGGTASIDPAEDDKTVFSNPDINTFTVVHTNDYRQEFIDKPFTGNIFTGNFLHLYSSAANEESSVRAEVTNNNDLYNFGDTTSFTIELKLKKVIRGTSWTYNWPVFFSKKFNKTKKEGYGWGFSLEGDHVRFFVGQPGVDFQGLDYPDIKDANWHSIAVVVLNRDFRRVMRGYVDGYFVKETILPAGFGTFDSNAPLEMGLIPTDLTNTFDGYLSDIRIWKAALPDDIISEYACNTQIDANHPYFDYLIGYWPGTDGQGSVMKDYSPAGNDFHISAGTGTTLQWNYMKDIVCPPSVADLTSLVPQPVDVVRQVLSWLAISAPESWGLDGRVWLNE